MFPILDNLVIALSNISDNYALPSSSCEIWTQVKHNFDKTALVKVTSSIKKDMERVDKLIEKLEKQKKGLKSELAKQSNTVKMLEASQSGLRATLNRSQVEHEQKYSQLDTLLNERISSLSNECQQLELKCCSLNQRLSQGSVELEKSKSTENTLNQLIGDLKEEINQERTTLRISREQHEINVSFIIVTVLFFN